MFGGVLAAAGTERYPDGGNTGPSSGHASAHTVSGGADYRFTTDLPAWTTGSGTSTDPYVIARTTYTGGACWVGGYDWESSDWTGKYIKFVDCWFHGAPTTGSNDGVHAVGTRTDTNRLPARITLDHCYAGPDADPIPEGGPPDTIGGYGYSILLRCPFDLIAVNAWAAPCVLGVISEDGTSAARSTAVDCWFHDQWLVSGDHTESINGVSPTNASNVTLQHCVIDGKVDPDRRTNGRVVYGVAIYNDADVTGWIIKHNLIKNADVGTFWDTSPPASSPGVMTSFTLKSNTYDTTNLGTWAQGANTFVTQSGNHDETGAALTL